jgi:prepilin-type N-terminal cleavage/methylation domain-containing protein
MSPRRPAPCHATRAFTIVELTVVLLIMAIMAAVAAPKYRSALASYRAGAAAGRVAADLRMIRHYAVKVSTPQTVQFNPATDSYAAVNMPDINARAGVYAVNLGASDYVTDVASANFGGSATVQFDIFGRPGAAGSVVVQAGGVQRTIQVDEAGNVSIL